MPEPTAKALPDRPACAGMTAGGRCSRRAGHDGHHATIGAVYLDENEALRAENEALRAILDGCDDAAIKRAADSLAERWPADFDPAARGLHNVYAEQVSLAALRAAGDRQGTPDEQGGSDA